MPEILSANLPGVSLGDTHFFVEKSYEELPGQIVQSHADWNDRQRILHLNPEDVEYPRQSHSSRNQEERSGGGFPGYNEGFATCGRDRHFDGYLRRDR